MVVPYQRWRLHHRHAGESCHGVDLGPELIGQAGRAIGAEARVKGFNVLLAGGINLVRDPRGGRAFEYFSEDPLLIGSGRA